MSAEQGNVQPWREAEVLIRESLLDGTVGGDLSEVRYNRAIMALTALTTQIEEREEIIEHLRRHGCDWLVEKVEAQIEELERKRDEAQIRAGHWRQRAEKAERALGEINVLLNTVDAEQPWTIIGPRIDDVVRALREGQR